MSSDKTRFSLKLSVASRANQCRRIWSCPKYENLPTDICRDFSAVKNKNLIGKNDMFTIFAQNIDCGYKLEPPRRVPIINVLEQKIRKMGMPLYTTVLLYNSGV